MIRSVMGEILNQVIPMSAAGNIVGPFRAEAATVIEALGPLAETVVPTGIFLRWGEALEWPMWMLEGTPFFRATTLPRVITLRDDLTIMANVLEHVGAPNLISSLVTDMATLFGQAAFTIFSAAPDSATLLRFLVKAMNVQNPHVQIALVERVDGNVYELRALEELGSFGILLEHVIAVGILGLAMMLQPKLRRLIGETTRLPQIRLRTASAETISALTMHDLIDASPSPDLTSVFVPKEVLNTKNGNCDPDVWSAAFANLRRDWIKERSPATISSFRLHIRRTIKNSHRSPTLDEISSALAISKRTINRKLSSLGTSYQQLLAEQKISLACEDLLHPEASVEQIAHAMGYATSASFGRAFKRETGLSCSEWRAQHANA